MKSSIKKFTRNHKLLVTFLIAGVLVAGFFSLKNYAAHRADALISEANQLVQTNPQKALVNYQVAAFLNPKDSHIYEHLVDAYLAANQPSEAVKILQTHPYEGSDLLLASIELRSNQPQAALDSLTAIIKDKPTVEAYILKSQALMELDKYTEATVAASKALAYNLASQEAIEQLVISQSLESKTTDAAKSLEGVPDSSAKAALSAVINQPMALARATYRHKLVLTTQRVLRTHPELTLEGKLLDAKCYIALGNLSQAKKSLLEAIISTPASVDAHQMLKEVAKKLGDKDLTDQETKHIEQLEKGSV